MNDSNLSATRDRLMNRWREVLNSFFKGKQHERLVNEIAKNWAEQERKGTLAPSPLPPLGERITIPVDITIAYEQELARIGAAATRIRNDAAARGLNLNNLRNLMLDELATRRNNYMAAAIKYVDNPPNRQSQLFYRILVECTWGFDDYVNEIFVPPPAGYEEMSYHGSGKQMVFRIFWRYKTIRYKMTVPVPGASAGSKHHCNGYRHKPDCT